MSGTLRPRLLVSGGILLLATAFRLGVREDAAADGAVPEITLQSLASGIGPITSIANTGDARLFLALQTGRIVIYNGGQLQFGPDSTATTVSDGSSETARCSGPTCRS